MRAIALNHVSIPAADMEESVRFYKECFGMEEIPAPRFGFGRPVRWLTLGDLQLHLFQREAPAPEFHHIGINVDDFHAAYDKVKELGIADDSAFFSHIYELPDGSVQMYIRDPAGNLVEIDWPDVSTLDRSRIRELKKLDDDVQQTGAALQATLYLPRREHAEVG